MSSSPQDASALLPKAALYYYRKSIWASVRKHHFIDYSGYQCVTARLNLVIAALLALYVALHHALRFRYLQKLASHILEKRKDMDPTKSTSRKLISVSDPHRDVSGSSCHHPLQSLAAGEQYAPSYLRLNPNGMPSAFCQLHLPDTLARSDRADPGRPPSDHPFA